MTDPGVAADVAAECRVFARYLTGADPSPYVLACYARGLAAASAGAPGDRLDAALLAGARRGPWAARSADAYARFVRPFGPLRRRLVLLLAVLETAPGTSGAIHAADTGGPVPTLLRLAAEGLVFALALATGIVRFLPAHLGGGGDR